MQSTRRTTSLRLLIVRLFVCSYRECNNTHSPYTTNTCNIRIIYLQIEVVLKSVCLSCIRSLSFRFLLTRPLSLNTCKLVNSPTHTRSQACKIITHIYQLEVEMSSIDPPIGEPHHSRSHSPTSISFSFTSSDVSTTGGTHHSQASTQVGGAAAASILGTESRRQSFVVSQLNNVYNGQIMQYSSDGKFQPSTPTSHLQIEGQPRVHRQ